MPTLAARELARLIADIQAHLDRSVGQAVPRNVVIGWLERLAIISQGV